LNDDQLTLLELLADDKSPKEIAQLVGQTADQIESDLRQLLAVLKATSTGQAVALAIREGLIGPYSSR
jgi:DNA-binding CsgD family transcriptional regulator